MLSSDNGSANGRITGVRFDDNLKKFGVMSVYASDNNIVTKNVWQIRSRYQGSRVG